MGVRWTPRQAGYDPTGMVVTTTRPEDGSGLVRHFVPTRHGMVART